MVEELVKENTALKQALAMADPAMASKFGVTVQIFDPSQQAVPRSPPMLMSAHGTEAPEGLQGPPPPL